MEIPYDPQWKNIIQEHIKTAVERSGARGVVLGLSGGLDSALVAALSVEALGADRVRTVHLPASGSCEKDQEDARKLAQKLGIEYAVLPIGGAAEKVWSACGNRGGMADANTLSRLRMVFLYYLANSENLLVMGTGNKTEILLGYFTKYGDGASDLLPIGDLYKGQVRTMAKELGIMDEILSKPPTAGLPGVGTDEEEIGFSYEEMDKILFGIEMGWDDEQISEETGGEALSVQHIRQRIWSSAHKRGLGGIPKIGLRTVGIDWREDRSA
ncbi:MAG: NAD+ synthase [Candidatus Thermoplasmatota archaeon]|nr:NAD+ synthase [Candidatus Thermoplasmatota archaeon]